MSYTSVLPTTGGAVAATPQGAITSSGLTMATGKLLGRGTATTGAIEEITLGTGLSFSGTTLNASASGGGLIDYSSPVSITGATTATISKHHVVSGTTSDYTITLPAASGNAGKGISIYIDKSATKLFTIDGNASETIDGATTRVMWAGESCTLLCDGSNWFKIAGQSLPMSANMKIGTNQTGISSATWTKLNCDTNNGSTLLSMVDSTNKHILIKRTGVYTVFNSSYIWMNSNVAAQIYTAVYKNTDTYDSTKIVLFPIAYAPNYSTQVNIPAAATVSLTAGDYLSFVAYCSASVCNADANTNFFGATEIVTW